jgi:hypothetical protein
VNFTWDAPANDSEDGYVVQVQGHATETVSGTSYRVRTGEAGQRVCLTVKVLHGNSVGEAVGPVCARSGTSGGDKTGSDTNAGVSR